MTLPILPPNRVKHLHRTPQSLQKTLSKCCSDNTLAKMLLWAHWPRLLKLWPIDSQAGLGPMAQTYKSVTSKQCLLGRLKLIWAQWPRPLLAKTARLAWAQWPIP